MKLDSLTRLAVRVVRHDNEADTEATNKTYGSEDQPNSARCRHAISKYCGSQETLTSPIDCAPDLTMPPALITVSLGKEVL